MADLIREVVTPYEPLRSNRWVVSIGSIPEWLVNDFKIRNQKFKVQGRKKMEKMGIKLDVSIRNASMHLIRPEDVIDCKKIKISFLDPTGVEMSYYDMEVELDTFEIVGDYGVDGLLMTECSFWVKGMDTPESLQLDEEILKNYMEKKG